MTLVDSHNKPKWNKKLLLKFKCQSWAVRHQIHHWNKNFVTNIFTGYYNCSYNIFVKYIDLQKCSIALTYFLLFIYFLISFMKQWSHHLHWSLVQDLALTFSTNTSSSLSYLSLNFLLKSIQVNQSTALSINPEIPGGNNLLIAE